MKAHLARTSALTMLSAVAIGVFGFRAAGQITPTNYYATITDAVCQTSFHCNSECMDDVRTFAGGTVCIGVRCDTDVFVKTCIDYPPTIYPTPCQAVASSQNCGDGECWSSPGTWDPATKTCNSKAPATSACGTRGTGTPFACSSVPTCN